MTTDSPQPTLAVEQHDPLGVGTGQPRLSWTLDRTVAGWEQAAYEIDCSADAGGMTSTGWCEASASVLVAWPFPALAARERVDVRVRVRSSGGVESTWSDPVPIEAGLLEPDDWSAVPIHAPQLDELAPLRPVRFRREFEVPDDVVAARLYISALGLFTTSLNGGPLGDEVLAPGWTSYRHRVLYHTYDVTDRLSPGTNAIGVTVAEGWFRGRVGFEGGRTAVYGDHVGPVAQLELRRVDGTIETIATDTMWRASHGPHVMASLYDGEVYDNRLHDPVWSAAGFDDTGWTPVATLPSVADRLVAPSGPPVRRITELEPAETIVAPSGATIVDFGQNISGRLRIAVSGSHGEYVRLRHAEVLEGGELGTRPLRDAAATDEYVLSGDGIEVWEPSFTIHGFRYVEVTGTASDFGLDRMRAIVCHSDMRPTGTFTCSNPSLTQLHENITWSMRGNFVSIPTDCPQRDERLGWSGDIQVFAPSAAFLFDCRAFLESWLDDLAAEQIDFGTVPVYVPWMHLNLPPIPTAAWGDAAVVVPWVVYQRFGDTDILRRQYPSMCAWVDQVAGIAGEDHLWNTGYQYGDWLDPAAPPDEPAAARTDPAIVATAYHAHSTRVLAEVATLLGHTADAACYGDLAEQVADAFMDEFVTPNGRLASDAPTAYALALAYGLLRSDAQRERAARRLVDLLELDGYHIGTGFVGTPIICDALAGVGRIDEAYHLLLQEGCPSWLYPVTMGATTVWERWDSMLPDGSINPGEMTSFNHYALGAVADFLHRVVAGLAPAAPGYRQLLVRPRPGGGLTSAAASLLTPLGLASVSWRRLDDELVVDIVVPNGATAIVDLPGGTLTEIAAGSHRVSSRMRPATDDPTRPPRRSVEGEFACGSRTLEGLT